MSHEFMPKAWENLINTSQYLPVVVKSIERSFNHEWLMEPNKHQHFEMIYVKNGSGDFEIAGENVLIGINDILIIKPDEVHKLNVVSKCGCEFIILSFKFEDDQNKYHSKVSIDQFLDFVKGKESGSYMKLKVNQKNEIIVLLNKILHEKDSEEIGSDFLSRLFMFELFVLISRALKMEWEDSIKTQTGKIKELVETAINYINRNFERELSISEIAKYVFLSQSYFTRVFKEHTGMSPQSYLLNIRIERAKEMIKNSNMKIGDIALSVGFSNQQRFNDMFKKMTGINPLSFRKNK